MWHEFTQGLLKGKDQKFYLKCVCSQDGPHHFCTDQQTGGRERSSWRESMHDQPGNSNLVDQRGRTDAHLNKHNVRPRKADPAIQVPTANWLRKEVQICRMGGETDTHPHNESDQVKSSLKMAILWSKQLGKFKFDGCVGQWTAALTGRTERAQRLSRGHPRLPCVKIYSLEIDFLDVVT
jgi:hypothetical protein